MFEGRARAYVALRKTELLKNGAVTSRGPTQCSLPTRKSGTEGGRGQN